MVAEKKKGLLYKFAGKLVMNDTKFLDVLIKFLFVEDYVAMHSRSFKLTSEPVASTDVPVAVFETYIR